MTRTVLGVAVVAVATGVGAGLTVGGAQTDRIERVWKAPPNLVAVPVVAKEIPVGTKVTAENLSEFCVFQLMPKADVPPGAVISPDDLIGKRTMRTLRPGDTLVSSDLNWQIVCELPAGDVIMTVPVANGRGDRGFLLPGYKVVVVATKRSAAKGKDVVLPLLMDALILEVQPDTPGADERQLSLAVTPEKSLWLAAAVDSGATIRVELPINSDRASYETDTRIMLPQAQTFDDLRAFLEVE